MTAGCDTEPVPTPNPAQQELLDRLRAAGRPRPQVGPELRTELRRRLESELGAVAAPLTEPLFANKADLSRVLSCEAHHVSEKEAGFEWSVVTARGTVAHKAIQLSIHRPDQPPPLALVDDALERLADDPQERIADWLLGLSPAERADLRAGVGELVTAFVDLWPPLQRAWKPDTESRRRADLCGDMVVLSGKVDLTLGAPQGLTAGRVVVDLKTGGPSAHHRDDLRFYAVLETLRMGVPPFLLGTYYLDSGELRDEPVTEEVLEAGVRRTVAAVRKLAGLKLGLRSPSRTANPACRWCRLREGCDVAAAAPGHHDQPA